MFASSAKPTADILKSLQAVPIAHAALNVKDSGDEMKAADRNSRVGAKLEFMIAQFLDFLRTEYKALNPGSVVPAWVTADFLKQTTLSGRDLLVADAYRAA